MDENDASPKRLSEEDTHQLFARAVELDHAIDSGHTVAELRQIAQEVGIRSEAFDLALRELIAAGSSPHAVEPASFFERMWRRLRSRRRSAIEAALANVLAATSFWLGLSLLARVGRGFGWQGMDTTILISCILGVVVARSVRARVVEIALIGLTAFQAAELAMHLLFGIRAVQGGPTHFAVMIAGIVGAGAGWLAARSKRSSPASPSKGNTSSTVSDEPPEASASGDGWFARIRMAPFLPARS
jgi:hypothetical protein